MEKLIPLFLITIFTACQTKPEPANDAGTTTLSMADSLTSAFWTMHEKGYINGFGVAIVNQEGPLYAKGIGYADIYDSSLYTENTIQNIGSVSKTFIGISLLKAQELGKLNLDDPVNQYLPFKVSNPMFPDEAITIRHLATHTSSITDTDFYNDKAYVLKDDIPFSKDTFEISEIFNPPRAKISMMEFLQKVLSRTGEWYQAQGFSTNKPGEIFEYSNIGATLAAAVLELATGQTFEAFSTEHILKPLGMSSSGWSFEDVDLSLHSKLYTNPEAALPLYSLITYPDGGLITSISDLSLYLTELIKGYSGNGVLLHQDSYKELFRAQLEAKNLPDRDEENDYDDEYNSGIFMGLTPRGFVGHTGGDPGIATYMFFDPSTNTGRILMINTSVRNSDGVGQFYSIWDKLGEYEKRLNIH